MKFQKLGKYTLLEQIAVGGMAEIYLAVGTEAEGVHKFFAIKQILKAYSEDVEFIDMFMVEAKIASHLSHENIVNVFDFGGDKTNERYIVMEYVHGRNLKQIIQTLEKENRKLPVEFIAFLLKEVARGLDYVHNACADQTEIPLNIVHRDVSPQNIMVSYNGEIKLIDFGISASVATSETTHSEFPKGKFGYLSPEQVRGEMLDGRTDVYSLGVIAWELLANRRLFVGETEMETLRKIKYSEIPDLATLVDPQHSDLVSIVNSCLCNNRDERYQSAQYLADALDTFLSKHFPEFNKHVFSDFLKNSFYQYHEKSNEKLEKYTQAVFGPVNTADHAYTPEKEVVLKDAIILADSATTNSSSVIESKSVIKKDLTWIYSSLAAMLLVLFYFIGPFGPRNKKNPIAPDIYKTQANASKVFETPFENISQLVTTGNQTCVATTDSKVFCWGDNRFQQLGTKSAKDYLHRFEITNFPKWESLHLGVFHSCGITKQKRDNQDWSAALCWGHNSHGQIGDPIQTNATPPVTIDPNTQYQSIAVGLYHTCGITNEGLAKCWGLGDFGQLGLSNIKTSKVPLVVSPNIKFKSIEAGPHQTCGIQDDGKLNCWGRNEFHQIGIEHAHVPGTMQLVDPKTAYTQISLGEFHGCGITVDQEIKCWGKNEFGQVGLNDQKLVPTPTTIAFKSKFKKVKVGKFHSCAETVDNELYCWGRNNYFQLSPKQLPQLMRPELITKLNPNSDFSVGDFSTCYSLPGKLACRGYQSIQNTRAPAQAN